MNNPLRILVPAVGAFAVASVVGIGVVMAQTGDDGTPTTADETPAAPSIEDHEARLNNYLDQLAENLGVSRDALDEALKQTALEMLDQAVADGKLTEDQAAEIRDLIESGEGPMGLGPGPFGGFSHGGFGGFGHGAGGMHGGFHGGPFHHGDIDDGGDSADDSDTTTSIVS